MSDASERLSADTGDVRDRVRQRFGARSTDYRASVVHSAGEDLVRLVQLAAVSPGDRALDVATGAGHTALALARAGAVVVASDITPAMLAETADNFAANGLHVETVLADAANLPFEDASFEIVAARMASHHFPDPAVFLAEVARVLRPGGRFALEDQVAPDAADGAAVINEYEAVRDPSHHRQLSVAEWQELVSAAGLAVATVEVLSKWVDFDWWTSIQNVSDEDRTRISALLANGPESARDWYTPEFADTGLVTRFRSPHIVLLASKPQ